MAPAREVAIADNEIADNEEVRILFAVLMSTPFAFGQWALLVQNAASGGAAIPARIAPRSLIQIRLQPAPNQPPIVIDSAQPISITLQAAGSSEPRTAEVLAVPYGFYVIAALPPDLPLGRAKLALAFNRSEKGEAGVEIVASNFALFSIVQGIGPAAAQNVNANAGIQPNGLVTPARPGDYVTLWGSGLGATPQKDVSVLLGEQTVPVQYAGPAPSLKGLDQINILVPDDVRIADGCYVPVVVQIGEQRSVPSSISKATGPGACLHPLGLSTEQMARLDAGGSVPFG